MIANILGGIGLFLLGMVLLSEGLKTAAGESLRGVLTRFTGGRWQAFLSGAGMTALVQSSSATVLATIGFVSAGLLTFTQAIGVIIGAAVGTTSTGWMVSLLGLRFSISIVALPLVGVGALLRLLTRGRLAATGLAIAGFGLIFVGIDTLQGGMQVLATRLEPEHFPGSTLLGRLLLLLVGATMTVVMQSSSAAVATTLAALHTGALDVGQAASLVIGHNMGTAVTAAVAAIGASVAARRTALTHVLFNATAGTLAFLLLPAYLALLHVSQARVAIESAVAVAAFHTGFNLLGAALVLPFAAAFAALITRLVPDRGPVLTRYLDATVVDVAPVAVEAARRTTLEVGAVLVNAAAAMLRNLAVRRVTLEELDAANQALEDTRRFLGAVRTEPDRKEEYRRHLEVLHSVDHLDRLTDTLRDATSLRVIAGAGELQEIGRPLKGVLAVSADWLAGTSPDSPVPVAEQTSRAIAEIRREQRPRVMERTARGELDADSALRRLDAMRWLDRLAYHVWRALVHMSAAPEVTAAAPSPESFPEAGSLAG